MTENVGKIENIAGMSPEELRSRMEILLDSKSQEYERLRDDEIRREQEVQEETRAIKDEFKQQWIERTISKGNGPIEMKEMPEDLVEDMNREIEALNEKYSKNGVYFMYCQFYKIIDALRTGQDLETETMGTYLSDNNVKTGEIFKDNPVIDDEVGLELMKLFIAYFGNNLRRVALIDDLNILLPDSSEPDNSDRSGMPIDDGSRMKVPKETSDAFHDNFVEWWREQGIIDENAVEEVNGDYLVIRESEKEKDAPLLVKLLEKVGKIEYGKGEEIWFQNSFDDCEDPRYMRIKLRSKNGSWKCAALDASGFIDERNREIVHLVCLSKQDFEEQQNQVWEILRVLGIEPKHYHNIFFDTEDENVINGGVPATVASLFVSH